jgi:putative transposase
MRHRHDIRPDDLRQPGWDTWIADACGLTDYSDAVPRTALAKCLLLAAALGAAVSAVTRRAADLGREVVRNGLSASLPNDSRALEARLAGGLRRALPRVLRRRSVPVAIDIHRRPYYGDRHHTPAVTGGKAEAGTAWFWSYATAVCLLPGHRHTLAVTTVEPSDTLTDIVERLLAQVMHSGIEVRYVLLDRAFYAAGVVAALRNRQLRFIIPLVRRGKEATTFFRRGCRGWFDHTFRSRNHEVVVTVRVAVVPGPDGNRPLVFACSAGFGAAPGVALLYGRRFGIESSYRQLGECLAVTTSRDVVYRLLLVGVSLLIRARWVELEGVTLCELRWDLILAFTRTATDGHDRVTQTDTPQRHTMT